ncbi:MAG: HAMP domain-containing histidine kinase [Lachnospiraceae bacterium]|nr:HAMP domain-containing histidine kinase [Lachnospiraceae bacterium]MBQ6354173.1 HAMP domain-containing histidine kinase [Lachnospiraceae bacterium]
MKLKNRLLFICVSMVLLSAVMITVSIFSYLGFQLHRTETMYGQSDPHYQMLVEPIKTMWETPQVRELLIETGIVIVLALCVVAVFLALWMYWSIVDPLKKVQLATENIKNGNLDFKLKLSNKKKKDEISELYEDFEEMRKRLKDNAEEKVEADKRDKEFISNISHDLKTPLTSIRGYCEGIMDGVASTPEKMDKYVRTIYTKTNEMDDLINQLTLYSNIERKSVPFDFNEVSAEEFFGDCAKALELELDAQNIHFAYDNRLREDCRLVVDEEQIRRVMNNIVSNSVKYAHVSPLEITMKVEDAWSEIRVSLADNGVGIAPKDLPHIFDRFYRADSSRNRSTGGSGIGLSIVKSIIEEHGGSVEASSEKDKGTVISFLLKKAKEESQNE